MEKESVFIEKDFDSEKFRAECCGNYFDATEDCHLYGIYCYECICKLMFNASLAKDGPKKFLLKKLPSNMCCEKVSESS